MNPEKRFSQIEELLVDVLAKQDEHTVQINQLANTSGKILEVALDAKDIAVEARDIALRAEKKADLVANAVANLTIDMQAGFARMDEQFGHVSEQFGQVNEQFGHVSEQFGHVNEQFSQVNEQFAQVNGRLDDMMAFLKERLK